MALVDLVKIRIDSVGAGTLSLGSATQGFRGVEALTNSNVYSYLIQQNSAYEVGTGTYLSGSQTLTRTPTYSSNGNGPINLSSGAEVSLVATVADLLALGGGDVTQAELDALESSINTALAGKASVASVTGKVDKVPDNPVSSIQTGYEDAYANYLRIFYEPFSSNGSGQPTGHLRACYGLAQAALGGRINTGTVTAGDATSFSPWIWAQMMEPLINDRKYRIAIGDSAATTKATNRILASWLYFQSKFTQTDMTSGTYGTNKVCGLSDDPAWFVKALWGIYDATGDATALSTAINLIPAVTQIFRDYRQTGSELIDPGLTINSIPFKYNQRGYLYAAVQAVVTANTTNASTTITVTSVQGGAIVAGQPVAGPGIPVGATLAFGTGTGGTGTYTLSAAATATATGVSLTTGASSQFGLISTLCETTLVNVALRISQVGSVSSAIKTAFKAYAVAHAAWTKANVKTAYEAPTVVAGEVTRDPRAAGIYGFAYNLDPRTGLSGSVKQPLDPSEVYHDIEGKYFGKDIRGLAATAPVGTLAILELNALLFQIDGTAAYATEVASIAAAYPALNAYGRAYRGDVLLQGMRDPWGEGFNYRSAYKEAAAVLSASTDMVPLKKALIVTAKGVLATQAYGYTDATFAGPEYNFLTGQNTWDDEAATGYGGPAGAGQGRNEQGMTASNNLGIIQAGLFIAALEPALAATTARRQVVDAAITDQVAARKAVEKLPSKFARMSDKIAWRANDRVSPSRVTMEIDGGDVMSVDVNRLIHNGDIVAGANNKLFPNNGASDYYLGQIFGSPGLAWDSGDGINYDKTANKHQLFVGNATKASVSSTAVTVSVNLSVSGSTNMFDMLYMFGNGIEASNSSATLGTAAGRFAQVYASNGTINTSDEREKLWRGTLTVPELAAAREIMGEIGIFQWITTIIEKGEGARFHVGLRAQRVFAILSAHGLDPFRYGFACYDEWEALSGREAVVEVMGVEEVRNRAGAVIVPAVLPVAPQHRIPDRPAGDAYGLRPDELIWFVMAGQEQRLRRLETLAGVE